MGIKTKAATIVLLGRGKLENIDQVRQERTRGFAVSSSRCDKNDERCALSAAARDEDL